MIPVASQCLLTAHLRPEIIPPTPLPDISQKPNPLLPDPATHTITTNLSHPPMTRNTASPHRHNLTFQSPQNDLTLEFLKKDSLNFQKTTIPPTPPLCPPLTPHPAPLLGCFMAPHASTDPRRVLCTAPDLIQCPGGSSGPPQGRLSPKYPPSPPPSPHPNSPTRPSPGVFYGSTRIYGP